MKQVINIGFYGIFSNVSSTQWQILLQTGYTVHKDNISCSLSKNKAPVPIKETTFLFLYAQVSPCLIQAESQWAYVIKQSELGVWYKLKEFFTLFFLLYQFYLCHTTSNNTLYASRMRRDGNTGEQWDQSLSSTGCCSPGANV